MSQFSGLKYFLRIAFPLFVSEATNNAMFFMDRLFLSHYGDEGSIYLNASLVGALTVFSTIAFFLSLIGYTNAMVAQYFGAGNKKACAEVTFQGIILSVICFPIILFISLYYENLFQLFDHSPQQTALELTYSKMLIYGSIFLLLRAAVSGFFMGIGNTKIIMFAHLAGMLINIPLNYLLIFGIGPLPKMGIQGAALGTILSHIIMDLILYSAYFSKRIHRSFLTRNSLSIRLEPLKKLISYGSPAGVELTLALGAFTFFTLAMNNYSPEIGTAFTIAINWESVFFIPLLGVSFATTVVVGQHLGNKDIPGAENTLKISLGVGVAYSIVTTLIVLNFTPFLISIFIPDAQKIEAIQSITTILLKTTCFYLIADAIQLSITGALRGAGDTAAVMCIHIGLSLVFGLLTYFLTLTQLITPVGSWSLLIGLILAHAIASALRYQQGKWKQINLIQK